MLLLRLCPIVPFNGLNYIGGVTKVSAQDFTLALVGTLPFQLLLVVIGATTETLVEVDLTNAQQLGLIITVCAGIGFGIVAMIATWKACQTELQKVRYFGFCFDSIPDPRPHPRQISSLVVTMCVFVSFFGASAMRMVPRIVYSHMCVCLLFDMILFMFGRDCIHKHKQALQVTDAQMERFLHPDDKLANDTMPSGIERNWIDESITTTATTNENDRLEQEEEWFWIWA